MANSLRCYRIVRLAFVAAATSLAAAAASGQEISLSLAGQWGGTLMAASVRGDRAYLAIGPRVVVLDVADPANPVRLGQSPVLPNYIPGTQVVGDYAYLACAYGDFQIVDVSDPAAPAWVGGCDIGNDARDVAVSGDYAYVVEGFRVEGNPDLVVVDVSTPSAPHVVGACPISGGNGWHVALAGQYAYVTSSCGGLDVIDISNPAAPIRVASVPVGCSGAIEIVGTLAYVEAGGLNIVDISNPLAPARIGRCPIDVASGVAVIGDDAYVTSYFDGLVVVDISDPRAPVRIASYGEYQNTDCVVAQDGLLYALDRRSGLHILDVSDPHVPQCIGTYDAVAKGETVTISDNIAYLTEYFRGIHVIDVTNRADPQQLALFDQRTVNINARGTLAHNAAGDSGFNVISMEYPAAPVLLGSCHTVDRAYGSVLYDNYAYVIDDSAGITVIDVADPTDPVLLTSVDTGFSHAAQRVDNLLYVADGDTGLVVLDLSDPACPAVIGSAPTTDSAIDVVIRGQYAYVATYYNTIDIFNISDPRHPALVGGSGYADHIVCSGDYLYLVSSGILKVLDLTDPTAPVVLASTHTVSWYGTHLDQAGAYVYVGDDVCGLDIFRITIPGDLNCDGRIDVFDIDPFVLALTGVAEQPTFSGYFAAFPDCDPQRADCNGDGSVNTFDIDPFVQLLVGGR
jgi:hypothetical protein